MLVNRKKRSMRGRDIDPRRDRLHGDEKDCTCSSFEALELRIEPTISGPALLRCSLLRLPMIPTKERDAINDPHWL